MKKKLIIFISLSVFIFFHYSCDKITSAKSTKDITDEDFSQISFKDEDIIKNNYSDSTIYLFCRIGFGTRDNNCQGGGGICFIFGRSADDASCDNTDYMTKTTNRNSRIIKYDNERSMYFIDHILSNELPTEFNPNSFKIRVNEDLYAKSEDKLFVMKKGIYNFDPTIGEYGGIRQYLEFKDIRNE